MHTHELPKEIPLMLGRHDITKSKPEKSQSIPNHILMFVR